MKPIYLMIAAATLALGACSQDIPASKVPSVVLNAVQAKYPGASAVEWEKKKSLYEAEFKVDSIDHTLQIDTEGKLIRHEYDIAVSALPAGVIAAIKIEYGEYSIDDAVQVEQNGSLFYEVELESKGKKDKKIMFSADGKTISNI